MNCSGGLTMTKAPQRWDASWQNNLRAAQLADEAGLEFLLPVGRWHGYRGETDTEGTAFETLTWASALLAATSEICIFGTLHVAFANPIFAAKQVVTADHVGAGRFGLNVVSGWNTGEYEMFGLSFNDHSARYAYTEEWMTIVKRVWSEHEPFDFDGNFFHLKGVLGKPKPYGGSRPILVSAGNSKDGRAFAARHADSLFMTITDLERLPAEASAVRATPGVTNEVGIFASGHLITRRTRREADEYYHYIVDEMGDWDAAEHIARIRTQGRTTVYGEMQRLKERLISGVGTFPVVGSYDEVAQTFKTISEAGLTGMAIGLVNYVDELPSLRDEILPRLEHLQLRLA
jgi:FMNH2-dependent dimethyl sulfone monooxygenase